jgi:serine/threonine protein kinase
VVRDPDSQRLEIRRITDCPTCGQPLGPPSPEHQFDLPSRHESFVDPDYFRLLGARHSTGSLGHGQGSPSSPGRRYAQPVLPNAPGSDAVGLDEAGFVSSTPAVAEGSRIRKEAFSPNYFKTFFVEEKELGRGGKGVVLLVRHEIDGCHLGHFACKRVPVGDDHAWLEKVLVEVELLAKLSHPNLVSYRHVWLEDVHLSRFGPSVACAFILQQYCNEGDLQRYVLGDQPKEATKEELKAQMRRRSKGKMERPAGLGRRLTFDEIFSLFRDITAGLAYLHAANYIHRDLKPNNCLLHRESDSMRCLISDFGEVQPENVVRKSTGSTGTISYCAPEVLRTDAAGCYGNFTAKSDVFSLGMILYFMCFGRLPYRSANAAHEELEDIDLLRAEITGWQGFQEERDQRPDLPHKVYQLLKRLLALDPDDRPNAAEVLNAMRSESTLETTARIPMSSSPSLGGLRGRRIQNLDSPMPPGTPVLDPRKSPTRRRAASPGEPTGGGSRILVPPEGAGFDKVALTSSVAHMSQRQASPTSPRRRLHAHAQSMSVSRSHDGYARSSPSRRRSQSQSDASDADGTEAPHPSVPLLLPPPTSHIADMRRAVRAGWVNFCGRNDWAADLPLLLFRLGLFICKLATLVWPCLPYMVRLGVGIPLALLAGLDLGMPVVDRRPRPWWTGRGVELNLTLLGLHVLTVWVASRRGSLCAAEGDV